MNRIMKSIRIVLLVLAIACTSISSGDCAAHRLIAEGGPYTAAGRGKIDKFTAVLKIAPDQASLPVWLTFYNGYSGKPGFDWVRVFLAPPGQTGVGGEVLVDERTFLSTHVKTLDMTGRISDQGNQLIIEGAGEPGAIFSWALTGVKADTSNPTIIKATGVSAGKSFLIHGTGFGADASNTKVLLDNQQAQVISVTQSLIEAKAPSDLKSKANLSVDINGKVSNSVVVSINRIAPQLTSLSPLGGPPGTLFTVQGANFSSVAANNIVKVGASTATVFKVLDTKTLLFYAPNWGNADGTLPLTVTTNGVPSSNHLDFWCTPHIYGGDPNASGYSED